ncbi:hypothetical protein CP8484711_1137B, partial [Chlamydia psittaci 84-8471/1]
PK